MAASAAEAHRAAYRDFTLPCGVAPGLGEPWLDEGLVRVAEIRAGAARRQRPPLQRGGAPATEEAVRPRP